MGTGIVSIALASDHEGALSDVLLAIAGAGWLVLALDLVCRGLLEPRRVREEARVPAALTGVAATAVLATRVDSLGWHWASVPCWPPPPPSGWRSSARSCGAGERPLRASCSWTAVATESLGVLAAVLAASEREPWLLDVALGFCALGLVLYVAVLARFDFGQLVRGRGDHWITGGALAISTLALTRIVVTAQGLHQLPALHSALKTLCVILWAALAARLVALVACEAWRPRLHYDVRRWATVFPLGMYVACSFDVGALAGIRAISDFARVWVWVALAGWGLVFARMVVHAGRASRSSEC